LQIFAINFLVYFSSEFVILKLLLKIFFWKCWNILLWVFYK
jgi:hypothetical protein